MSKTPDGAAAAANAQDGHDEITLTHAQDRALDAALDMTTNQEVQASIQWLRARKKEQPHGRQPQ